MKPDKINVACPHCGHVQLEPRDGYSTVCKKCQQHYRLEEVLHPKAGHGQKPHATRQVKCFQCGTVLDVAVGAESTMCKRCSSHIDLRDYSINQAVSKNFRTHGSFVVGEKGYVFNTEAEVGDAVIRGRFLGKLHAHRSLTLYSPEQFKGSFKAELLIVPAATHLVWKSLLDVNSVEIAGELVADLHIPGAITLKSSGQLFGNVEAANLIVEPGAVLVGQMKIGPATPPPATPLATAEETTDLPGLDETTSQPKKRKSVSRTKKQS
jgi:cytoskeletal protein CcmA (bactofilin family)/ribosomal protein S27E